jgi:hypothetical protein
MGVVVLDGRLGGRRVGDLDAAQLLLEERPDSLADDRMIVDDQALHRR